MIFMRMKFHEFFFFSKCLKYLNNQYKLPKSTSILQGVQINEFANSLFKFIAN